MNDFTTLTVLVAADKILEALVVAKIDQVENGHMMVGDGHNGKKKMKGSKKSPGKKRKRKGEESDESSDSESEGASDEEDGKDPVERLCSDLGVVKSKNGSILLKKFLFIKAHGASKRLSNIASTNAKNGDSSSSDEDDDDDDDDDSSSNATLFVANIGECWSKKTIQNVFERFGKIKKIDVGNANTCKFGRIEFSQPKSIKRALQFAMKKKSLVLKEEDKEEEEKENDDDGSDQDHAEKKPNTPKWMQNYYKDRPGNDTLKIESDEYMTKFAQLEKEEEIRRKELAAQQDDDGFTVVTYKKGSKAKPIAPMRAETITVGGKRKFVTTTPGAINKKKNKKKTKFDDFYRFQMRDKKRDQLAQLREKFEQDKQHIDRLKNAKKFKPF